MNTMTKLYLYQMLSSDIWRCTSQIAKDVINCCFFGYFVSQYIYCIYIVKLPNPNMSCVIVCN